MGSCLSSKNYSVQTLSQKCEKENAEVEDLKVELDLCEKRLADMANKALISHNKYKCTKRENDMLKMHLVTLREKNSDEMNHMRKKVGRQADELEKYQFKLAILENRMMAKKRLNLALIEKYTRLERAFEMNNRSMLANSLEASNQSTISSKSFF